MEPSICKPEIYKGAGIYKGAAGLYKGRGLYNDGEGEFVDIGGKKYPVIEINNLKWIAYNLDWAFPGLIVGGSHNKDGIAKAFYYDDNEELYSISGVFKCGLLYNWFAVWSIIANNILPDGWRVASNDDWNNLISFFGNDTTPIKIKDNTLNNGTWPQNWGGSDDSKMGIVPGGACIPYPDSITPYQYLNEYTHYWTSDSFSSIEAYRNYFGRNDAYNIGIKDKEFGYYIRLCKDE